MASKTVAPSIHETAFNCPHCGAYTSHTWFHLHASERKGDSRTPGLPDPNALDEIKQDKKISDELKERLIRYFEKTNTRRVFFERLKDGKYIYLDVYNLHLSRCFACSEITVWVYDQPVFPAANTAPSPNSDLPPDILRDYQEAGTVLSVSPRGAAALLRLAIQKLCIGLGEKGKSIDDDIAALVRKGLSPVVQKALDSVRVIGNEAVHPGTIDLRDDAETALSLFRAVNVIAEQLISNPKHVAEIYGKLPPAKREAIQRRDAPDEQS
jgi:hypothetical protein